MQHNDQIHSSLEQAMQQQYSLLGELVLGSLFLGLALDLNLGLLLIELHELGKIELGLLEELDLSDEDVLEGEDLLALLNDLLANRVLDAIQPPQRYKYNVTERERAVRSRSTQGSKG